MYLIILMKYRNASIKILIFKKLLNSFTDRRGSHPVLTPSQPHPAVGCSVGRVDRDSVILKKNETGSVSHCGDADLTFMLISPWNVAMQSSAKMEQ
jgi:hypothetical protein